MYDLLDDEVWNDLTDEEVKMILLYLEELVAALPRNRIITT